jgi:hypothetical protein
MYSIIIIIIITIIIIYLDRLCGLLTGVPECPGSIPGANRFPEK